MLIDCCAELQIWTLNFFAGFSVKQIWTFDCRVVSCCLAPLTTETANGSAGNAFRIGCIGLGAMRISLAVLGSYSTSWTSRRNLLKESKRIWNLWDMYNQLRSLTLPYAKQTSKVLAPARSSPHPSAIVSTGKVTASENGHARCLLFLHDLSFLPIMETIRMCEAEIPGVLKSQKLSVQEKNIGRLESAHAFLKSIENCENWPIKDIQSSISECERAPGITKSSQSCKHEKTWPMPKTSWARQSTLKRPSETLGQNFNGTFCWGMLASKLKNLTKVYKSYILIHTSRPTKLKCRDGYATYSA